MFCNACFNYIDFRKDVKSLAKIIFMAPDKGGQNDSSSLVYEEEYLYKTVNWKNKKAEEERPKILPPHKSKNMVPDGRISFLISNQKSKSYHLQ